MLLHGPVVPFEGSQLDLNRQAASLWWQGRNILRRCHVPGLIRTLLSYEEEPDMLVIHTGGNDLEQVPLGDLRLNILTILDTLHSLLPPTKFVYSQILPRLHWRHEVKHFAIEKARKRLNSFVATVIISAGGCYIKYPDICEAFQLQIIFITLVMIYFFIGCSRVFKHFCLLPFVCRRR